MLRKLMIAFAIAVLGLMTAGGVAVAGPSGYAADGTPEVAVNDTTVPPGSTVVFSGSGYTPGETVLIEVHDANGTLIMTFTVVADENGNFSVRIPLSDAGVYNLTATGETSGTTLSQTVTVAAATGGGGGGKTSGGGLAYTGASIAGPLAIGAGAIGAGLLLLFFGTRTAIRRKHGTVS